MEAHTKITLAINVGTRCLGCAILKGNRLITWQVKTFPGKWGKEKLKIILAAIRAITVYYKPDALVLKWLDPVRVSPHLISLLEHVSLFAQNERLPVKRYSIYDLLEFCGVASRNIKQSIADTAVELYPELRHEYLRDRNSKQPYYQKMFEAVVAARWYIKSTR